MTKYYAKKLLGRADVSSAYADHPNWKKLDNLNKVLFVSTHETILPTLLRNYDRDKMCIRDSDHTGARLRQSL